MIKKENYPNAYKEVYVILNNVDKELINKVPISFINMIKSEMNKNYKFELNENVNFEDEYILTETKGILAYIFLNYWGTKEQKDRIMRKFQHDIMLEEQKNN